jgi:hypothetical protein
LTITHTTGRNSEVCHHTNLNEGLCHSPHSSKPLHSRRQLFCFIQSLHTLLTSCPLSFFFLVSYLLSLFLFFPLIGLLLPVIPSFAPLPHVLLCSFSCLSFTLISSLHTLFCHFFFFPFVFFFHFSFRFYLIFPFLSISLLPSLFVLVPSTNLSFFFFNLLYTCFFLPSWIYAKSL